VQLRIYLLLCTVSTVWCAAIALPHIVSVKFRLEDPQSIRMDFATPAVFSDAKRSPDEDEDPTRGLRLDVKMYEARYNWENKRIKLNAGTKRTAWVPPDEDQESALSVARYYDHDKELEFTEMEVRSPHIRRALREVVKKYPRMTFDTGKIIIRNEPRCIFHFRNELREYGMNLTDVVAAEHLMFFLNYMYNSLTREMTSFYTFMESPVAAPGIEFEFLWMAFKPGELIVQTRKDVHQILRVKSVDKIFLAWQVNSETIVYDGESFGFTTYSIRIPRYEGYKPLMDLRVCPLSYHPTGETIRNSLITRGHKYVDLKDVSHRKYSGTVRSLSPYRVRGHYGEEDDYTIHSLTVSCSFIIDSSKIH
jgi:hypothetical protein